MTKEINNSIENYAKLCIEWQRKLVNSPALAPEADGNGEWEKAEFVITLLKELSITDIQILPSPDDRVPRGDRPNIIARIPGEQQGPVIWIMAHLDVVPAGDISLWDSDPFKLEVKGDELYGRGVEDNHQGLISALLAVKALRENNTVPHLPIGLAIVADEENGSKHGLQYLMQNHRNQFSDDDLIIVPDAGDNEGVCIEIAEKSILWTRFKISGKQCHASTPDMGINAHRAAAHLTVELEKLHDIFNLREELFDPPVSTFEPTRKESNVPNINTIPASDVFYLDCRILPNYSLDEVIAAIDKIIFDIEQRFNVQVEKSFPQKVTAAPPTGKDTAVVQRLSKAITAVIGKEARLVGIGGGTVASFFREEGLATAVWSTIVDTGHMPNELSLISNTLQDAKVFAHLFTQQD
jgi:succinyl-diaminopimelate desuccinylase